MYIGQKNNGTIIRFERPRNRRNSSKRDSTIQDWRNYSMANCPVLRRSRSKFLFLLVIFSISLEICKLSFNEQGRIVDVKRGLTRLRGFSSRKDPRECWTDRVPIWDCKFWNCRLENRRWWKLRPGENVSFRGLNPCLYRSPLFLTNCLLLRLRRSSIRDRMDRTNCPIFHRKSNLRMTNFFLWLNFHTKSYVGFEEGFRGAIQGPAKRPRDQ